MLCHHCSTNLPKDVSFCPACGTSVPRQNSDSYNLYNSQVSTSYGPMTSEGETYNLYTPSPPPPPSRRRFPPRLLTGLLSGIVMLLLLSGALTAFLILKPGTQSRSPGRQLATPQPTIHSTALMATPQSTIHSIAPMATPQPTTVPYQAEDGHVWHTLRHPNGSWTGLGDVNSVFAIPGPVRAVSATSSLPGETQYMFTTADGHLWHTIRRPDGSWSGLEDVNAKFAIPGPVRAVSATSSLPGETQYMFTTADGHLWHTLRHPDGSWTGLGDINALFAIPGPVRAVSATSSLPGETQFMFATADGHLWHTLRHPNGSWAGLGDVNSQFAIPGPVRVVSATSSQSGETQFMFATADGHLWHTLRHPNGSWAGLGDVNSQFAIPGPVRAISAASSQPGETQFMFNT